MVCWGSSFLLGSNPASSCLWGTPEAEGVGARRASSSSPSFLPPQGLVISPLKVLPAALEAGEAEEAALRPAVWPLHSWVLPGHRLPLQRGDSGSRDEAEPSGSRAPFYPWVTKCCSQDPAVTQGSMFPAPTPSGPGSRPPAFTCSGPRLSGILTWGCLVDTTEEESPRFQGAGTLILLFTRNWPSLVTF